MRILWLLVVICAVAAAICGCGSKQDTQMIQPVDLGTASHPLVMAFVHSSTNKQTLLSGGEELAKLLTKDTGLMIKVVALDNYAAAINGIGAGNVHIAWLSPIPYVLAKDRFNATAILTSVRNSSDKYCGCIIVRNDSGIKSIADLKNKRMAFVDPLSTSGCIYPKHLMRSLGLDPNMLFSGIEYDGSHDKVVEAVYSKKADAGAIYCTANSDARDLVKNSLKDVMQNTTVIAKTMEIPNDTVTVSSDVSSPDAEKLSKALIKLAATPDGKRILKSLYGIDGFTPAKSDLYASVKAVANSEDVKLCSYLAPPAEGGSAAKQKAK